MNTNTQEIIDIFVCDTLVAVDSFVIWLPIGFLIAHEKSGEYTVIPILEYREFLSDDTTSDERLAKSLAKNEGYTGVEVVYFSYNYTPTEGSEERVHRMFEAIFEETLKEWRSADGGVSSMDS